MKRSHSHLPTTTLGIGSLVLLLAAGCGSSTSGGGVTAGQPSALTGKVDSTVQASASGSLLVTASRINADGSLSLVSDGAALVGKDGRYSLSLVGDVAGGASANLGGATQLMITAIGSDDQQVAGEAVVEAVLDGDGMITAAPISVASTAAAHLLIGAKSAGLWRSDFSFAEMRVLLTDDVAASLVATVKDDHSETTKAAARAIFAASVGLKRSLQEQGVDQDKIVAALKATLAADARLDAALDANGQASAVADALVYAFHDVGVTTQQLAVAFTAAADLMTSYTASLSASARAALVARANVIEAQLVTTSVEAQLLLAGAKNEAVLVVIGAGEMLEAQLEAAAQAGAQVSIDVQQAWQQYKANVDATLQSTLSLGGQVMSQVQAALSGDVQVLAVALVQVGTHGSIEAAAIAEAQALARFDASVLGHTTILLLGGLSDAQAKAWLTAELNVAASLATSIN